MEIQIKNLVHPQTSTIEHMLDRKLNMMTLQITQQFNLRCEYCIYSENSVYNRKHSNAHMSVETAKKSLDFYKEHTIDAETLAIAFYGGEPLLHYL